MTGEGDFWTRRKAAVLAEEQAEDQGAQDAEAAQDEAGDTARLAAMEDADVLAELGLPDPAELAPGDNVRGFMAPVVPERLRRRALRQLWRLNPMFANLDGLVDYGEDFTDAATVVESLQTAYQVGRGMQAHLDAIATPDPDSNPDPEPVPDQVPDQVPETAAIQAEDSAPALEEVPAMAPETTCATPPDPIPPEITPPPAPRRMHFAFEG